MKLPSLILALLVCTPLLAQIEPGKSPEREASRITSLARLYYNNRISHEPEIAYFLGIEPQRHDGLLDNSPRGWTDFLGYESWILQEARRIDPELLVGRVEWITYAYLLEEVLNRSRVRVCQDYLWNVSQMGGWHTMYPRLAELQPVGTDSLRKQALIRWRKYPAFIGQEQANLLIGIRRGYSAPKPVVRRVIEQVDGLMAVPLEDSQLTSPARRDDDPGFAAEFTALVRDEILPAYQEYRDFLEGTYLPLAREELSVLANPKGRDCYEALLRSYTTLERSPEEVFELGQQTVAANRERVVSLGREAYGLDDFSEIIGHIKSQQSDRFGSGEELLQFARDTVTRAHEAMPRWFGRVPDRAAAVEPYPEYQEGTGVSARYEPGDGSRPGVYRIPLYQPEEQIKGQVEATAFHEVWPGHHLQFSLAQSIEGLHDITRLVWFSGMGEGWGRYSEGLAAEAGLYNTVSGPILRLAWPARGMVVDPGIHIFGWTREQAVEFMGEAGRMTPQQLDDMVDRIAILPGQLTAYDSGGLEILALRAEAEAALGPNFDIRAFHDTLLENGTLPLTALRQQVERWIESERLKAAVEVAPEEG